MGSVGEASFGSGPCGAGANHETDGVETKGASLSPLINLLPDPIIYRVHLVFLPLTYPFLRLGLYFVLRCPQGHQLPEPAPAKLGERPCWPVRTLAGNLVAKHKPSAYQGLVSVAGSHDLTNGTVSEHVQQERKVWGRAEGQWPEGIEQ